MTDEEIEALCEEATPGPWEERSDGFIWSRAEGLWRYVLWGKDGSLEGMDYDMKFVCAARTLVPELLAAKRAAIARAEAAEAELAEEERRYEGMRRHYEGG